MSQLKGLKFKNADANTSDNTHWYDGLNLANILNQGAAVYTSTLKSQTDAENAAAAVQLEKLKIQQQQAAAQASAASSQGVVAKIKAYALPIAITGAVVIGGIAAYFYFKKKA